MARAGARVVLGCQGRRRRARGGARPPLLSPTSARAHRAGSRLRSSVMTSPPCHSNATPRPSRAHRPWVTGRQASKPQQPAGKNSPIASHGSRRQPARRTAAETGQAAAGAACRRMTGIRTRIRGSAQTIVAGLVRSRIQRDHGGENPDPLSNGPCSSGTARDPSHAGRRMKGLLLGLLQSRTRAPKKGHKITSSSGMPATAGPALQAGLFELGSNMELSLQRPGDGSGWIFRLTKPIRVFYYAGHILSVSGIPS